MSVRPPDITALLNLHAEGRLAVASIRSLVQAAQFAEAQGLAVEILMVLDKPTAATSALLHELPLPEFSALTVSFGDAGKARNAGVEVARGNCLAFLDGDDLWGENWLAAAHRFLQSCPAKTILHPQASLYFGSASHVLMHVDMNDDDFDLGDLCLSNLWTALSFSHRETYLAVLFRETALDRSIGYEDWGWNIETICRGYRHRCVPGTLHAVRKRDGSVSFRTTLRGALPPSPDNFANMLVNRNAIDRPDRATEKAGGK